MLCAEMYKSIYKLQAHENFRLSELKLVTWGAKAAALPNRYKGTYIYAHFLLFR